jgi:CheY-like chemotaxis protein
MPESRQRTVLIVDGEAGVRRLLRELLQPLGFRVLLAADSHEALDILGAEPGRVDIAMVDQRFPEVEGSEYIALLRTICPNLPCLLTGGERPDSMPEGCAGFVPKPFRPVDLAIRICAVHEDAQQGAAMA